MLAQTAVTLDANAVTAPAASTTPTLVSALQITGPFVYAIGQTLNSGTQTMKVLMSGSTQFYRILSRTAATITNLTISGGNVVITYQ